MRAAKRNERRLTSPRKSFVMQSMKKREGKVGMRREIVRRCWKDHGEEQRVDCALEAEGRKRLRGLIALCEFVYASGYCSIFHRV